MWIDPRRPCRLAPALALLLACSGGNGDDDADADADGGDTPTDGAVGPEIAPPEPPAATAAPVLTPCPAGWREVVDPATELAMCEPWPADGPADCAEDEAHFPGEPGCASIGTPCPAGEWPEGLPTDVEVRYVRAGDPPGGDGSRASPFGTIGEALLGASSGTVFALSKGTFTESVLLPHAATLWGACVAETVVREDTWVEDSAVIFAHLGETTIRNLRIAGARPGVRVRGSTATARLEDVVIAGTETYGVRAEDGGSVIATGVVLRDVRPDRGDRTRGHGLRVSEGGQAELTRVVVRANRDLGLHAEGMGTLLRLEGVAVRETLPDDSDVEHGAGIVIVSGARLEATAVVVEENRQAGIAVYGAGAWAVLEDVVVRDTAPLGDGTLGAGVYVAEDALLQATRLRVERCRMTGIHLFHLSGAAVLADVFVRDVLPDDSVTGGYGMAVLERTRARLERGWFEGNAMGGLTAGGTSAVGEASDVVVRGTRHERPTGAEAALSVGEGGSLTVRRARLEDNDQVGILLGTGGSTLDAEDVVARTTRCTAYPGATPTYGTAVLATEGSRLTLARATVEDSCGTGVVLLGPDVEATLSDLTVRDTSCWPEDGTLGRGLDMEDGAVAEITRAVFERNREAGLLAFEPGTVLRLTDVVVRETLERDCVASWCAGAGGGIGLGTYEEGRIEATRFRLADNALCGVQIAPGLEGAGIGGEMDLHDGEIVGHPVGVNLQVPDFDVNRLTDRVIYRDNDRDLDATELPVPGAGGPATP